MATHKDISISAEFKEVEEILAEWKKDNQASRKTCIAIIKLWKEEHTTKIDDFQTPNLELNFLPRLNEPLTKENLKQLSDKDVNMILKMTYYNKKMIEDYLDSLHRWDDIKKELDRAVARK